MKFELKDYQEDAAAKVLSGLRKGSREYAEDGGHTAVSLSAPTGAGKTVIAAAVIERVLFGDPEGSHDGDPDAVFLWLTDDPSLNEQTRKKLLEASDRIQPSQLVTLDEGFDSPQFERSVVYFLNIQKLGKNSNLVVRKEGRRTNILWDTISDTIRDNGAHYYLIIDEAHRGTGKRSGDAQTIMQRLMNGSEHVVRAAPVVLGISATPERFDEAVKNGHLERVPRKVAVPVAAVRESGLVKDVLAISYRGEHQEMDVTLVRQAAGNLRAMDEAWSAYTSSEDEPPVRPVLVLQIPPNAGNADVGALLDVCVEEWEALGHRHALAHCLESHTAVEFGPHAVAYVKPQDIQDHPAVRLVVFKEALTTGWDCPRAEVMISLRTAKDATYIAQLIGRMVRSPLARRIADPETLNRVRLYLPRFDKAAVEAVKAKFESDDGGLPTDVEINSVDAPRNSRVPAEAFAVVEALPSYQVPGPIHRSQVARLHKLAALLVGDGLLQNAISAADAFLIGVLEAERARLDVDGSLAGLVKDAHTATVEVLEIEGTKTKVTAEVYDTDAADIDRLFAAARRKFRDGLADRYWGSRVTDHSDDPLDAKALTVALSTVAAAVEKVESEAADRVRQWLDTYGDSIANLSEDKKAKYAEVRAMARAPEQVSPGLPTGPISMSGDEDIAGFQGHLYSDAGGVFRARLGSWEAHVLAVESARPTFAAWYRNPSGGQRAIRVPYDTGSGYGKLYPDFVFLHTSDDGKVRASIIDPHGHHLADAGNKLRGLGAYAEQHGSAYARICAVIKNANGDFRMLDLKEPTIRAAVKAVHGKDGIEQVFAKHGSSYN
jgi:type III restriction enzyme